MKKGQTMADNNDDVICDGIHKPTTDWQQGKPLGACLVEMFNRCLWTDIKFRCKDHEDAGLVQAHRNVLAARSPFFMAMFFGPCADGRDEVDMNTAQTETLRLFLRYLYCDIVELTDESALAVLEIAHCYQVSSLVQYCADFLATVITSSNVCRILTYALRYELTNLKNACCSIIDTNAEQVLKSDGFMHLSEDCLLYILKGDTFYEKEETILDTAEKWSSRKVTEKGLDEIGTNIRTCLGESFYQLRLPTMTYKSLMVCTSRKGYLSIEEYADIAAFINEVPDVLVSTNSCIRRVPLVETVTVNSEKRHQVIQDSISTSFEISATKDVALSRIVLREIKPYFKLKKEMFPEMSYGNHRFGTKFLSENREGIDLPDNLSLVLSCSLVVEGLARYNVALGKQKQVMINPPILLKKSSKPHIVVMNVKYRCENGLQINTTGSEGMETCKSVTRNITVRSVSGKFAGVERIEFRNLSNRDSCNETKSETTKVNIDEVKIK